MLNQRDRVRLRHMLEAARRAARFAAAKTRADLQSEDDPLSDALIHLISVIGEAANKVSPETRAQLEEVPWADLVGMRNRLVHVYMDVDLDILWATVQDSLPLLISCLEGSMSGVDDS